LCMDRASVDSTWQLLNPALDNCPLTFCDYASVDSQDLVGTDLIYPHRHGKIYHIYHMVLVSDIGPKRPLHIRQLRLNKLHQHQMLRLYAHSVQMLIQLAKDCPHPLAAADAQIRESLETRSIPISRLEQS
ncbi:hypothetical protein B0T25DRAFT_457785, partial [Lasiosphaeria hispida]